jgi:pimeloyl-ACP methyl ester carboxylesterase
MKFEKRAINVNGRKTFYLDSGGRKPAIVLLHGFPGNHFGMIALAEHLGNDDHRLIIPDLPACGSSAPLEGEHNLKNYSDWLDSFLEILSVKEAVFIGHSFGSRISLVFANDHGDKIKKLILITPVLKVDGLFNRILSIYYGIAGMLPGYLQKMMLSNGFGKTMGDKIIFKSSNLRAQEEIIRRDIKEIKKIDPRVSIEIFDEFYKFSLIPRSKLVKNDTLVIAGGADRISPLAPIQELVSQLPSARLEIMENCGHLLPLEEPEETASIIERWLGGAESN